jgi:hypothetical protein
MRAFVFVLVWLAALSATAAARGRYEKMKDCADLGACMAILDAAVQSRDNDRELDDERQIALRLSAFGAGAKKELLARALGADKDWRDYAGAVLQYWPAFDKKDVPSLIQALQFEEGGWAIQPLARIRSQTAVCAVVGDGQWHDSRYYKSTWDDRLYAIRQFGNLILPCMLDAMQTSNANLLWELEADISQLGKEAVPAARPWAAIAVDEGQPFSRRVAALRGLAAIGLRAAFVSETLHPLLKGADDQIRETTTTALEAMRDPISFPLVIPEKLKTCRPSSDTIDFGYATEGCIAELAIYGDAVLPIAAQIEQSYLNSPSGADRAATASLLGYIGYRSSVPRLTELLDDPDWRVVYAAARSLGWLGARDTIPSLQKVAENHWLPEVQKEAVLVIDALHSASGTLDRTRADLKVTERMLDPIPVCGSAHWDWRGSKFDRKSGVAPLKLAFADGTLEGGVSQRWEYDDGLLEWQPTQGQAKPLLVGFVKGILRSGKGAIAVFSEPGTRGTLESEDPFSIGYAVSLTRNRENWQRREIARLPGNADGVATISDDLFAVWSGNRAVVFSDKGILGIATCESEGHNAAN